ncbi:MAG: DUF547 domain-containing protein [Pseudomonadota bacterium]
MSFRNLFFALIILVLSPLSAQAYQENLEELLKSHVKPSEANGIQYLGVDYDSWAADLRHATVKKALLETNLEGLDTKDEKLAFWINAYNFLVIDLVITTEERENIRNQAAPFKSPGNTHKWKIGGVDYTLDQIIKNHIRTAKEPRAYFALNRSAISSPDLRREVYRADQLDSQLNDQVLLTLTNPTKGLKFEDGNILRVTRILKEYEMEFAKGDIRKWLKNYYPDKIDPETTIGYFKFDWSLNKLRE